VPIFFSGLRVLLRFFIAKPPAAMPAIAAPPASSGVFAFEAISPALVPAELIAPFGDEFALLAVDFARDPPELERLRA
jgi:hypothetical protein